jgi:hypothetical protein
LDLRIRAHSGVGRDILRTYGPQDQALGLQARRDHADEFSRMPKPSVA